jgi:hypothetical protein
MARGHFLGRWRQFKLNQDARLAQLAWSAPPPACTGDLDPERRAYWAWSAAFLGARLMACSWSAGS